MELSKQIELIITIFEQCQKDYEWYVKSLRDAEAEETNLAHKMIGIEQGQIRRKPPTVKERNRIATSWQNALLKRDAAKDCIRRNQPMIDYIESDEGKRTINTLKAILGKTRKTEGDMDNRKYAERSESTAPENPVLKKDLNKLIADWKKQKRGI